MFSTHPRDLSERVIIAASAVVLSLVLACSYSLFQLGFGACRLLPVVKVLAFGSCIQLGDLRIVPYLRRFVDDRNRWIATHAFVTLAQLIFWTMLGYAVPHSNFSHPEFLYGPIGLILLVLTFRRIVREPRARWVGPFATVFFLGIWICGRLYARDLHSPLFIVKLSLAQQSNIDTLFHISICNMLRTYGVASVGVDGLPWMHYHFGSHWIFAQWSNLLHLSTVDFYNVAFPCIVVPFLFRSIMMLVLEIRTWIVGGDRLGLLPWLFLFMMFSVGVSGHGVAAYIFDAGIILSSESYCLGVAVLWLLFSFWLEIRTGVSGPSNSSNPASSIGPAIVTAGWLGILGIIKIMLGALGFGLFLYAGITKKWFREPSFILSVLLTAFGMAALNRLVVIPGSRLFGFMDFYLNQSPLYVRAWHPFLSAFWCYVLFILICVQLKIHSRKDFIFAVQSGHVADLEIAVTAFLGALAAGIFMVIPYQGVVYFFTTAQFLACVFVAARLPELALPLKTWICRVNTGEWFPWALPVVVGLFFLAGITAATILQSGYKFFIEEHQVIAEGLQRATHRGPYGTLEDPHIAFVQSLASLGERSLEEKRKTAVYIPRTYGTFWSPWPGMLMEISVPLLVPSLTGSAMLLGMPRQSMDYYCYSPYQKPQLEKPVADRDVCEAAARIPVSIILSPEHFRLGAKPVWVSYICSQDGKTLSRIDTQTLIR